MDNVHTPTPSNESEVARVQRSVHYGQGAGSSNDAQNKGKQPMVDETDSDSFDDDETFIERDARRARQLQRQEMREAGLTGVLSGVPAPSAARVLGWHDEAVVVGTIVQVAGPVESAPLAMEPYSQNLQEGEPRVGGAIVQSAEPEDMHEDSSSDISDFELPDAEPEIMSSADTDMISTDHALAVALNGLLEENVLDLAFIDLASSVPVDYMEEDTNETVGSDMDVDGSEYMNDASDPCMHWVAEIEGSGLVSFAPNVEMDDATQSDEVAAVSMLNAAAEPGPSNSARRGYKRCVSFATSNRGKRVRFSNELEMFEATEGEAGAPADEPVAATSGMGDTLVVVPAALK